MASSFIKRVFDRVRRMHNQSGSPRESVDLNASSAYEEQMLRELATFRDQVNVHDLPPIFHYWSGKYLAPKLLSMGFEHPDDFFTKKFAESWARSPTTSKRFISIGAGNCDTEIRVAKRLRESGFNDFVIECLEINPDMIRRGAEDAKFSGVAENIAFVERDFNTWIPSTIYDCVMANQSLHHVVDLEHLFESIKRAMGAKGRFVIADMIGRNGHQLWPEARALVENFWTELPSSYKYNHQLKRHEEHFMDWDSSTVGFEGIRAQDILPLLIDRFYFELFLPFANVVSPFIGRGFGHNFSIDHEEDKSFIDRVQEVDEQEMLSGRIKPTQMFAVLSVAPQPHAEFLPGLTPQFCVRVV
jgi:SAM-dependent methyltransferase